MHPTGHAPAQALSLTAMHGPAISSVMPAPPPDGRRDEGPAGPS